MNIYLFEKNINPLQIQKNNRELEIIIQDCILITIRDSIPTEAIIRAYLDESIELEEEITIENIEQPILKTDGDDEKPINDSKEEKSNEEFIIPDVIPSISNIDNEAVTTRLSFNDYDSVLNEKDNIDTVNAPKTIERLEEISTNRAFQRKLEEDVEDNDDSDSIKISNDDILLDGFDDINTNFSGSNEAPVISFDELF